jgi:hypothetical protein
MKQKKILLSAIALSLLTCSCASYSADPLSDLVQTSSSKEEISVFAKTFTKADCKKFFDRDVISKGYQPVQIYIKNNSNLSYSFSLDCISLPIARPDEVAKKVHTSTVGRVVGYGAGAAALSTLLAVPMAFSGKTNHLELLYIPAVVDGYKSSSANSALDADFALKAAKNKVIFPHSSFNGVIFIPLEAYRDSFTLTLVEQESEQSKTFNITSQR